MGITGGELSTQPECWRRAARLASQLDALLPDAAETAVLGCGTSFFMAQCFAAARETKGLGVTDAFIASEPRVRRKYEVVVAISRSGTTTEVLRALEQLAPEAKTIAISAVPGSPVTALCDDSIVLEFADERSIVQTRFATSALALLLSHVGNDIEPSAADAELALVAPVPPDPSKFDQFVFLGEGWNVGLAHEAALKVRETCGAWSESYAAMEYRHGPVSAAGQHTLVWALADVENDLLSEVAATGAHVLAPQFEPLAELVLVQRMAVELAGALGRNPDQPRHLSRSVLLP